MSFPDSNSPIMEQMSFFHDHSMLIILMITIITIYMVMNIIINNLTSRSMMEGQEIEIIWTIIPAITLIFIAMPSLHLLYLTDELFSSQMSIKIIGHQWYWSYEYSDFNKEFDSFMIPEQEMMKNSFRLLDTDNNLVIPFNTTIKFLITSADVIHSWSLPSLSIKMDAIPGRLNQAFSFAKRPGMFYGQCSEICGANHSFMPISLEIVKMKNFIKFISS
ncbi:cytochrome c oxidase subunit II (mitochondrion) [Haemaphysalis longicornis]|uniref:Cytochrome c oxidase subunit 2 n=1 Tax=Haemaphysalis longicornis TaxID=44386 RepID=A0A343VVM4_HAELO|nr:cytochrome c oxidase subunit II [Haemaphysalis longicornis]AVP75016.1 cytochrome c oxidase subunit II [Haemaphysalis longicornis]QDF58641.1 cytochrome c oxidase subunit 2 [Haemaphysalis longicornis]QDF58654.1 cytochrome c oxidase subunit 2 [Haemaphysalis longicornis]QOI73930.1 cytochrome c oxidase subunit II [Haemaphysalis longicornis]QTK21811.1 cytochrome c oxidase subunit 2 [Haemaphysalis longicornis]